MSESRYEPFDDDSDWSDMDYCIQDHERSDSFGCYFFAHCDCPEDRDLILKALNEQAAIAQQAERIAELEEAMRNYFNACDSVDENLAEDDWPAMNRIQAAHNAMKALLAQGGSDE